ncbi:hypothetical protein DFH08DRAFT_958644 [Mycena albidolilacea]|uniref:Uncharacterized protein n=1 Tax=Mycena albidolilacea TaxID=1033008 RepID=A0AAD7A562_9AGAR|nr:hypothetical protein DFH08DRAFT_958644 [Mycena albidolilacea]
MKNHSPLLSSAASTSSLESFDTIRQAASTAATSIACSNDQRWSEVVPPDGGLTFAVVWDPEQKDILTFSTAELSESHADRNTLSLDSPADAYDNRSQVLTIGTSTADCAAATPATMQFFRQNHDFLFADPKFFPDADRPTRGRTQTSSTLDGLDVYLRGSMLAKAHNANRYYSCFQDLDGDFAFDPQTSFAYAWMQYMKGGTRDDVSDEGFFEGGQFEGMANEPRSRFSGTTTSTGTFVAVKNEMDDQASADWSALEAPNTPGYSQLLFAAAASKPASASHRRLRKLRPVPGPASPSDVLDRSEYSHNVPVPPCTPSPTSTSASPSAFASSPSRPGTPRSHTAPSSPASTRPPLRTLSRIQSLPKIARGLTGKWKKTDTGDAPGWVWIDVKERAASASAAS